MSALALAANGCKVYIVGRRREALDKVVRDFADSGSKGSISAIQADVSCKEGIDHMVKEISAKEGHINLLLNSMSYIMCVWLNLDHGVSLGCADINACEQTAEGIADQMYNGEDMDKW